MKSLHLLIICILVSAYVLAQQGIHVGYNTSAFEPISDTLQNDIFFDNDEPLSLTLKYDITSFIRNKEKGEYLDAELSVRTSENDSIVKHIRLKARGNFRRTECFFPPIYLNFKTDPIENTELKGVKKIKLVTHCSNSNKYHNYVLKEYLIYKLYNSITENSFKVKMLDITYIDTGKKARHYKRKGFLIEPIEVLCQRINAREIETYTIRGRDVLPMEMDIAALFNYMIGNCDWRVVSGHNLKFVRSNSSYNSKVIPILYDFDHAGLVGPSYAIPPEWTRLKSIHNREYLGYCREDVDEYYTAIEIFMQKKDEILETIDNFHFLDDKSRQNVYKYIQGFYKLTKKPDVMVGIMRRECRTIDF